ncbi:MAG: hypothetical protein WA982_00405 [Rubrobacteraceae bacterium]
MYDGPGVLYEIVQFAIPASVFGLFIGLGVFAGVYFALLLAMKRRKSGTYENPTPKDAFEIVRERYARGEISRKDYEQLREDLGDGP